MNRSRQSPAGGTSVNVDAIARAVLYEGYSLYPYRRSALKNQRRVLFGTLAPRGTDSGEASEASAECLLEGDAPDVEVSLRYLHEEREEVITVHGETDEAIERGRVRAHLAVKIERIAPTLVRVGVRVQNRTAPASVWDEALVLGAAHFVLRARDGRWISLVDPPARHAAAAKACTQKGLWPVLVGERAMLASPIILEDNPAIASESKAGDLYDATEIEEILALRVQTLTDAEKAELRHDEVTRSLLERVEALGPNELAKLHGVLRRHDFVAGDRVTIHPKARADAFDVLLAGMAATVVSIETTLEGEELVCVTVDRDPGKDLGDHGFPGHRFFFRPDELARRTT